MLENRMAYFLHFDTYYNLGVNAEQPVPQGLYCHRVGMAGLDQSSHLEWGFDTFHLNGSKGNQRYGRTLSI